MTNRKKKILFYSAIVVFLLLSYVAILYAQGYKYSISERDFFLTGTIALKANESARVFFNDEFEGNTSFFNNAYSIERLLPGTYKLSLNKDSYSSWTKTVTVEEGFVVDFPHVLLLPEEGEDEQELFDEVSLLFKEVEPMATLAPTPKPQKPTASVTPTPAPSDELFLLDVKTKKLFQNYNNELKEIASNVEGFRLSENENKLAWWTSNELWILWLTDQNYQPFYKKDDKELITRFQITIQNAVWFRGEDHLVLELEQLDSKQRPYSIYRVIEIDKRGGLNIIEL